MRFISKICASVLSFAVGGAVSYSMDTMVVEKSGEMWGRLDHYRVFLASRYFDRFEDFKNLALTTKRFRLNTDRFFFNPIPLSVEQLSVFPFLRTYNIYDKNDKALINDKMKFYEVWFPVSYTEALEHFNGVFFFKNEEGLWRKQYYDVNMGKVVETALSCEEDYLTLNSRVRRKMRAYEKKLCALSGRKEIEYSKTADGFGIKIVSGDLMIDGKPTIWRGGLKIDANFPRIRKWNGKWSFVDCQQFDAVDDEAFKDNDEIKEIIIPDSIKRLGRACFKNCQELETAVLPDGLEVIGRSCFQNCPKLKIAKWPNKLQVIDDKAFRWCTNVEFDVPPYLRKLGDGSLQDTAVVMHERNAELLITVPPTLRFLGAVFGDNDDLAVYAKFNIKDEHEFEYLCGVKFKEPQTMERIRADLPFLENALILYPHVEKEVTIPGYVESVRCFCFYEDLCIDKLIVDRDVRRLEDLPYIGCSGVKEVLYHDHQISTADEEALRLASEKNNRTLKKTIQEEEGSIKFEILTEEYSAGFSEEDPSESIDSSSSKDSD